ncbi:unnamed protein product [Camellia sinensis]
MIMMIRRSIFGSISQYQYQYLHNSTICSSSATNPPPPSPPPPLSRVATLVEGCDYEHWLVVVEPPKGYPLRTQILNDYIKTLAIALGSEEEAKKSIYSVSTKYYYAFGCKIPENLTHKIKSLPNVRWVLPDSYLCHSENDYGGEPFVEGEVVSYDERYHADWLRDKNDCKCQHRTRSRKARRKKEREKNTCRLLALVAKAKIVQRRNLTSYP